MNTNEKLAREAAESIDIMFDRKLDATDDMAAIILKHIERATEKLRDALERSHNRVLYVKVYDKGNFTDWQEIIDQNLEAMGLGSTPAQPQ